MFRVTKNFIFSLFSIFIIFLILIAIFENKNIMIINMKSKSGAPLEAEFYYTKGGLAFDDSKMSRRYKVRGNNYYFRLPSFDKIAYARLDPAKRADKIKINNILIISSKWFKEYYYSADIKKSEIVNQISNYKITKNGISFTSTGDDPQLNINLTRKFLYSSKNYHLDVLIIAILIYIIMLYLYNLSKTEELNSKNSAKLILYGLFLAFALFKVNYYKEHIHHNYSPDNIAHLSYIQYIHNHKDIIPKFENMYMITNSNAGNYLGHPPLYYYIMNLVYDKNKSIVGNVDNFKSLNTAIFMISIVLFFYLGFSSNLSILGHFVYLSILSSIPMHAYLGGNITNDNLAILGGSIFAVGLYRILKEKYNNITYLLIAIGAFISFFSKFTAALLVFFAVIYFIIYLFKYKINFKITTVHLLILALFITPIFIYQTYIILHYHAIIPTLNVTHPQEYLHSPYFVPENKRLHLTFIEWLGKYWSNIHAGWFGILSHHSLVKVSIFDYIGLLILHIFAIVALFLPCSKEQNRSCILGKITLLALLSVSFIQLLFSYKTHLHSGYTGGLQPRYLLPFMFSFAIMSSVYVEKFKNNWVGTVIIILLSIQALYSDFFYFLRYYI